MSLYSIGKNGECELAIVVRSNMSIQYKCYYIQIMQKNTYISIIIVVIGPTVSHLSMLTCFKIRTSNLDAHLK